MHSLCSCVIREQPHEDFEEIPGCFKGVPIDGNNNVDVNDKNTGRHYCDLGAESCATEEILTDVDLKSIATNNLRRAAMPRNTIVISYAIVLYHRSEEYRGQPSEEYHTAPSGERSQPSLPPTTHTQATGALW